MKFYVMYGFPAENYALPGPEIEQFREICEDGAIQLLDPRAMDIELDSAGGLEFPDLLWFGSGLQLVSSPLRSALLELGQTQIFFKPVNLIYPEFGINEPYWLMIPPRIDCLVWEKCAVKENSDPLTPFWARFAEAQNIVIDGAKTGRYGVFKLPYLTLNQEIIADETVKRGLKKRNFTNLFFDELDRG